MSGGEATTLWARAFTDELARAGVREVVVAPGSRSTPLVFAIASDPRFRTRVHLDERSAGFFALGVGKASGVPAAVVTTSGTATANLLPAVIEAAQSEAPLLLLTADRPHRLRGADANQAIDQTRLYGPYARAFFEVAPPTLDAAGMTHLRALAGRAVLAACEDPAGPVHVNFPFEKPLEPADGSEVGAAFRAAHPRAAVGREDGRAFVTVPPTRRAAEPAALAALAARMRAARHGVVVAGPASNPGRLGPAAARFAAAYGFPLLADPLSGARFGPSSGALVVDGHDLFLRDAEVRSGLAPDLVVRVGASPTSAALQGWMERHADAVHVVVDGGGRWKDHAALATDYVHADAADALLALAASVGSPDGDAASRGAQEWTDAWRSAAEAARRTLRAERGGEPHEGWLLEDVVGAMPAGGTLFVSSSMPVRDLDAFAPPREAELTVRANRGASGVDGIVSTAFGVAAASRAPTVCVLGDVALFHDLNGLLWAREADAPLVLVLVDNDGGGIFHMLPVREHEPHFTRFFATPHGLDFRHAAELHGIPFQDVEPGALSTALTAAFDAGGTHLLRVRSDRVANQRRHREVAAAVAGSVREALG